MNSEFLHSSPLNSRKFRLKYQHEDPEFEERQMVQVRCALCPNWGGTRTPVREMGQVFRLHQELYHA